MVAGRDGQARRSHVERRINASEAAVVCHIFEPTAQGRGKTAIAKILNEEGAPAPRAQQGRPSGWAASSVHEILHRPLYRGEIVWNRTRKRNAWGQQHQSARPEREWMRSPAPELRIVSEERWAAAPAPRGCQGPVSAGHRWSPVRPAARCWFEVLAARVRAVWLL
jgi:hypothetical protein